MFTHKVNASLLRIKTFKYLLYPHVKLYNRKIDTVAKRGSMLIEFVTNKDKRNKWHFNIMPDKPKARVFDKIHKPHRRRAVLNSLFIHNITDVISTGDISPEISKYNIEITGVQISPCCKILNVFWQVPVSQFDSCDHIAKELTISTPKIRAELISRNVLGRVPFIYFLRDSTNAKIASFEKAMEKLHLEPVSDSGIVVDDSFVENIFEFKSAKGEKKKTKEEKQELPASNASSDTKLEYNTLPEKPEDIKSDIFGLNHGSMMEKIIALKKKKKGPPAKTAVISPESLKEGDLFEKIPGVLFAPDSTSSSRSDILKRFQIERKILMKKSKEKLYISNDQSCQYIEDDGGAECDNYEEDFIDDEDNSIR